ncbi:CC-NBS-LRR resistance protein, partial [Trifolium pratense]
MGKTTLAQLVFNDHRIMEQFDFKVWVRVSESFDLTRLTRSILESIDSSAVDCENYILQRELQQRLAGKRYLLVLDDVWNKDRHTWDNFILRFSGSSGCKMIVTTRNMEVASVMRSTRLLHLKQLEENDSWSLFVKYAFRGRNVFEYPNLELIGKKIVKKCGGLPLALKTLGSILQTKSSEPEWVKILESNFWHLPE